MSVTLQDLIDVMQKAQDARDEQASRWSNQFRPVSNDLFGEARSRSPLEWMVEAAQELAAERAPSDPAEQKARAKEEVRAVLRGCEPGVSKAKLVEHVQQQRASFSGKLVYEVLKEEAFKHLGDKAGRKPKK